MFEKYILLLLVGGSIVLLWLEAVFKAFRKEDGVVDKTDNETHSCSFRDTWIHVEPAPLKVKVISEGKIQGQLVMHGPFNGVLNRILILHKREKMAGKECVKLKHYRLKTLTDVHSCTLESAYDSSVQDSMKIAEAVFRKKNGDKAAPPKLEEKPKAPQVAEQVASSKQPDQRPADTQAQATEMVPAAQEDVPPAPTVQDKAKIIQKYGFVTQYVGKVVSAGVQQQSKGGSTFPSYTVEVETDEGLRTIFGVDLQRAMRNSKVSVGDQARIIHVSTEERGTRLFKHFQVVKLNAG